VVEINFFVGFFQAFKRIFNAENYWLCGSKALAVREGYPVVWSAMLCLLSVFMIFYDFL